MNDQIKSVLEFAITKVRENQLSDCDGNKYVAGTNEAYIKGKLERYMTAYNIKVKGVTVDFIYNLVAEYCGIFEPIRRFAIGVIEEGNECAVRIWCLLLCRDEKFREVAKAVGRLYIKDEPIDLSKVRKELGSVGINLKLADVKLFLLIMTALGVLQETANGTFDVVEKKPEPGSEQYVLVNKTTAALKMVQDEEQDYFERLLLLFPFFGKEVLKMDFEGDEVDE